MTWTKTICYVCSGHGLVSDYSGGDFNGATECDRCDGTGRVWLSPKGAIVKYPGGPFIGRLTKREQYARAKNF